MVLTSHLSLAFDAFSPYRVSFSLILSMTKMSLMMSLTMMVLSLGFTIESGSSALCLFEKIVFSVDCVCGLSGN